MAKQPTCQDMVLSEKSSPIKKAKSAAKKSICKDMVVSEKSTPIKKAKSAAKKSLSKIASTGKEVPVKKVYKKKALPPVAGETFDDWGAYRVKCVPLRLFNIISNLSDSQKEALREIGFGGLLHLNLTRIPSKIVPWFVVGFKDGSLMFKVANQNPKQFLVSKFDVHDCFLLPYGPDEIEIVGTGRSKLSSQPEAKGMKEFWRSKYNVKGNDGIPLSTIHDLLVASSVGDENFKQNFVLFAMSTFLAPTSNAYVDLKILKAVEEVARISEYDWCSYILNSLSDACRIFATSPQKKKSLCGCLPLLMISYFHRFDFKGMISPMTLPLIQHWDDKSMEDRANAEICTGSLGNAPISSTVYPISQNNAVISVAGAVEKVKRSKPKARISQAKAGDKSLKKKFIVIPDDVDDDDEIHSKAVDDVHELLLLIQRDSELFHSRYEHYYATMKEKLAKLSTEASMSNASPTQMTPTQAYYNDTEMLRYIDEVVEMAKAMRKASSKIPSFEDFSKDATKHVSSLGDDDIAVGNKSDEIIADVLVGLENDPLVDNNVPDKEMFEERVPVGDEVNIGEDNIAEGNKDKTEVRIDVEDEVAEQAVAVVDLPMITPRNYVPSSSMSFHPFLLHAEKKQSCMVVVPENLGCSEDCGQPIPNHIVLAKVIIDNMALFAPVFSRRLDVMDYCLTDDLDAKEGDGELLVFYGLNYFITREDMLSLLPGQQIYIMVLDCWSILLNDMACRCRATLQSSRCFFGTNHNRPLMLSLNTEDIQQKEPLIDEIFSAWDIWQTVQRSGFQLDADMVFLPLHTEDQDHFSCVCINFIKQEVEYLDNRKYDGDLEEYVYGECARLAANLLGRYLVNKGFPKGADVEGFPMVNVPFSWQSGDDSHNNDCGLFVMMHMLLYVGIPFDCGLGDSDKRILFRAEIAATLVMSDINDSRNSVLTKVQDMFANKQLLLAALVEKRGKGKKTVKYVRKLKRKIEDGALEKAPKKPKEAPKKPTGSSSPLTTTKIDQVLSNPEKSPLGTRKRGKPNGDGLGCSLDCGEPNDQLLVVSRVFRSNGVLFKNMKTLRKEVADYCFLVDYEIDQGLLVAIFADQVFITREDMMSMFPTVHMHHCVVECWSMLLNELEFNEKSDPSLMFFGIGHVDTILSLVQKLDEDSSSQLDACNDKLFSIWDLFISKSIHPPAINADLIFLPMVLEYHFFCVCVNFRKMRVEVLDQTSYSDWNNSQVCKVSRIAAGKVIDYLESKQGSQYEGFDIENVINVPLAWQTSAKNETESGTFLLMHMLHYEGEPFDADIGNKLIRRNLIAEIAATLVLADCNQIRKKVLNFVQKFAEDKPKIWEQVSARRKIKEILSKQNKSISEIPVLRQSDVIPAFPHRPSQSEPAAGRGEGRGRGKGRGRGRGRGKSQC